MMSSCDVFTCIHRLHHLMIVLALLLLLINVADGYKSNRVYSTAFEHSKQQVPHFHRFSAKLRDSSKYSEIDLLTSDLQEKLLQSSSKLRENSVETSNFIESAFKSVLKPFSLESRYEDFIPSTNLLPKPIIDIFLQIRSDLSTVGSYLNDIRSVAAGDFMIDYSFSEFILIGVSVLLVSAIVNSYDDSINDGQPYGPTEKYNPTLGERSTHLLICTRKNTRNTTNLQYCLYFKSINASIVYYAH